MEIAMNNSSTGQKGFSLVELLIALVISAIVGTALVSIFITDSRRFTVQTQVVDMQQTLRAGLDMLSQDLLMAGYDPTESGNFGITDIRLRNLDNNLDTTGNSAITFTVDISAVLSENENGLVDGGETISYSLGDFPVGTPDGRTDLGRNVGAGRFLLAENVDAIGLAYAFDQDGDRVIDTSAGGNLIWAMDTDNDNVLDTALDTNDDGVINADDDVAGDALPTLVNLDRIRAVQIWLLVRNETADTGFINNETYVVANRRLAFNDNFRRRTLSTIVKFRNLGL
jgi:type IV pilus assembly protein PilW